MSDMKCPVCNRPMKQSTYDYETAEDPETLYCSYMPCDCVCSYGASKAVWEALGIAVCALKTVRRYTAINQFAPKSREAHIVAKKALAEITALTKGGGNE